MPTPPAPKTTIVVLGISFPSLQRNNVCTFSRYDNKHLSAAFT